MEAAAVVPEVVQMATVVCPVVVCPVAAEVGPFQKEEAEVEVVTEAEEEHLGVP
jgi:hypothetical protein